MLGEWDVRRGSGAGSGGTYRALAAYLPTSPEAFQYPTMGYWREWVISAVGLTESSSHKHSWS